KVMSVLPASRKTASSWARRNGSTKPETYPAARPHRNHDGAHLPDIAPPCQDHRDMEEVDDRTAIRELLLRYARGVDARDTSLVGSFLPSDAAYRRALAAGALPHPPRPPRGALAPDQ